MPRATPLNVALWRAKVVESIEDVDSLTLARCLFFGPIPLEDFSSVVVDTGKYQ